MTYYKQIKHKFIEENLYFPTKPKYIIIGTFPSVLIKQAFNKESGDDIDFYYGSKRNHFWKLIEHCFTINLLKEPFPKQSILKFLENHNIAMTDIIAKCNSDGRSSDQSLRDVAINESIIKYLMIESITDVFFTSCHAQKLTLSFLREKGAISLSNISKALRNRSPLSLTHNHKSKNVHITTLYSPSPRVANRMKDKVTKQYYKSLTIQSS